MTYVRYAAGKERAMMQMQSAQTWLSLVDPQLSIDKCRRLAPAWPRPGLAAWGSGFNIQGQDL